MGAADSFRFCLWCGSENDTDGQRCLGCGGLLEPTLRQEQTGIAFLLNELDQLRAEGVLPPDVHARLRERYRPLLAGQPLAIPATPSASTGVPAPSRAAAPPREEGPGWLAEQQANLLLYLGAFLIVIATLVYVGYSGNAIGAAGKSAVLALGTCVFLVAGLLCRRFPNVEQAGVVFFGVGALMLPLNFVGIYAFYFADDDLDPTGLWLGGSLVSAIFYSAVAMLGIGRWYAVPATIALLSALGAALTAVGAPGEAYPGSFIALALLLAAPSQASGKIKDTFGLTGFRAAQIVVPLATIAAFALSRATGDPSYEDIYVISTRWFLPPTLGAAAVFYWAQSLSSRRTLTEYEGVFTTTALALTAAAAVTVVYAAGFGEQWYGPAVAIAGWLFAAGSEGFGPRWYGQRQLGWMALGAITVSWVLFEGLYPDWARQGAGVHFAAAAFYLAAARSSRAGADLLPPFLRPAHKNDEHDLDVPVAIALLYAAGLTLGIGSFQLLSSFPAAENARASDASWPFFGLSLAVTAFATSMRWWWPSMRLHTYVIALGISLFVLLSAADIEGPVTLLLAIYIAVALVLALYEREPLALAVPATFGFFAILAAWRYYTPTDAYLPLAITAIGCAFFATHLGLRNVRGNWMLVLLALSYAYLAIAPVAGWARLAVLADQHGFVGDERFEATALYQTSALSVALLGAVLASHSWVLRDIRVTVGASAVLMVALLLEIGHFHPENAQAYTAPLGAYLLAGALLATRWRGLPADARVVIGPLEAVGAALIMGPSFAQSLDDGGWLYGILVLVEGLAFVALAIVQRRLWLVSISIAFVVLDSMHYLFFAGGPALPNWAILAIAGIVVMLAGTAILLGRDRWTEWQRSLQAWWSREPLPARIP